MMTYEQIETRVAAWAAAQPDIRAVLVVGSRARGDADAWSDLDLIALTTDRERYAADSGWLRNFGALLLAYAEPTDPGDAEWYALYDGSLKVDIVLLAVEYPALDLSALLRLYPYQGVFARGVRVIFDRLGEPRDIPPQPMEPAPPPTAAEFDQVVSGCLMASVTTAKFIARGDFLRAQRWFANDLRVHLLRLIEWHAHGRDTWYSGRFIDQWADRRVLAALPQMFPAYDRDSLERALLALLDLVRWLGAETADKFGCAYPAATHAKVTALVRTIFTAGQSG